MLVNDIMSKNVASIEYDKTVLDACQKYQELDVGSLVVVKANVIVGIITERDMIQRVILDQKNPKKTRVDEIMSKNIKTIHASAKVEQAAELMKKFKIKRLPVIKNNEFVGIITVTDLANVMPELSKTIQQECEPFKFVTPSSY